MNIRIIPVGGINPYADHPGFEASACPIRTTVSQTGPYGGLHRGGFGCEMTGGHCLPDDLCAKRRADAAEQDKRAALFAEARRRCGIYEPM